MDGPTGVGVVSCRSAGVDFGLVAGEVLVGIRHDTDGSAGLDGSTLGDSDPAEDTVIPGLDFVGRLLRLDNDDGLVLCDSDCCESVPDLPHDCVRSYTVGRLQPANTTVHVGPDASELIPELSLAIRQRATLHDVAETIHVHPTLSEAVMEAAEHTLGRAIHTSN